MAAAYSRYSLLYRPRLWSGTFGIYAVSQNVRFLFFLQNNCQKLTDFNNFWYLNPETISQEILQLCPRHLSVDIGQLFKK